MQRVTKTHPDMSCSSNNFPWTSAFEAGDAFERCDEDPGGVGICCVCGAGCCWFMDRVAALLGGPASNESKAFCRSAKDCVFVDAVVVLLDGTSSPIMGVVGLDPDP